jgi:hypothetical protein
MHAACVMMTPACMQGVGVHAGARFTGHALVVSHAVLGVEAHGTGTELRLCDSAVADCTIRWPREKQMHAVLAHSGARLRLDRVSVQRAHRGITVANAAAAAAADCSFTTMHATCAFTHSSGSLSLTRCTFSSSATRQAVQVRIPLTAARPTAAASAKLLAPAAAAGCAIALGSALPQETSPTLPKP